MGHKEKNGEKNESQELGKGMGGGMRQGMGYSKEDRRRKSLQCIIYIHEIVKELTRWPLVSSVEVPSDSSSGLDLLM